MKNPILRAACRAAFVVLLSCFAAPVPAEELAARPEPWRVIDVVGPVEVRHGDQDWQPLAEGALVVPASQIRTGRAAMVVLARGQDQVQLMSRSSLELPPAQADGELTRLIQWFGRAFFDVDPRPSPHFEVETPYLTAIVKGTSFVVEVSKQGASVAVDAGVVAVAAPGGTAFPVRAGQTATAYAGLSGLDLSDDSIAVPRSEQDWPEPDFNPVDGTIQ